MKQLITGIALFILVTPSSHGELKDGDDLYEKAGPNSAFLRVINLDAEQLYASIQNQTLNVAGSCEVSPTIIVEAGTQIIEGNDWRWQGEVEPQQIYTLAVRNGEVTSFAQDATRDPMRAKFEVFNLSSAKSISVLTSAQGQSVFSDISPAMREERPLNPLRVELEISTGENSYPLEPIAFARGRTTSLLICDGTDALVGTIVTE